MSSLLEEEDGGFDSEKMALLIGVYGGKLDFLNEYKQMLASRLLALGSFEIERELASLELLRIPSICSAVFMIILMVKIFVNVTTIL